MLEGLLVLRVAPESPAERAGLPAGDVVVGANGQTIRITSDLRRTEPGRTGRGVAGRGAPGPTAGVAAPLAGDHVGSRLLRRLPIRPEDLGTDPPAAPLPLQHRHEGPAAWLRRRNRTARGQPLDAFDEEATR
jgi:hypothetical protein